VECSLPLELSGIKAEGVYGPTDCLRKAKVNKIEAIQKEVIRVVSGNEISSMNLWQPYSP